jgi:hypothetical protein
MIRLSPLRIALLRGCYLLMFVGLGLTVWPGILTVGREWALARGVVNAMLAAMGLLAVLGLRHPLRMLPLLLFETAWKLLWLLWLLRVVLPLWLADRLDAATTATAIECLGVVLFLVALPWRFIWRRYVLRSPLAG